MKRIICLLLATLFIVSSVAVGTVAANDSGSPKHIPRIVSVVFDDSGSMFLGVGRSGYTDRWAYASYAMQTFVAMMDPEDVLHVTFISNTLPHDDVELSLSEKQNSVNDYANIQFGGGTKNKLKEAGDLLVSEFKTHGTNAKYYYIVMADGVLDAGEGDFATALPKEVESLRNSLAGAEFDAMFFAMGQDIDVGGVRKKDANTGEEIVTTLRDISAEIMGRTIITDDCTMSNGILNFSLKYPAHSVTVFAQKTKGKFENVSLSLSKDGKKTNCKVNTYYVACPEELTKSYIKSNRVLYDYPIREEDRVKTNPVEAPRGFVSIATNGDKPIPKGKYSIDLSKYDLSKNDLIVLVEPAVQIGCKFTAGDSVDVDFENIKGSLTDGDVVKATCGLYEINPDGSLGEQVPLDVLSPDYKLYINGTEITEKDSKDKNSFVFTIDPDHADKELKVEAMLEGYQPFVKREKFGKISPKIQFDINVKFKDSKLITKKDWQEWKDGKVKLEYPLTDVDSEMLSKLNIKVNGYKGIKDGACTDLDVKLLGNNVVFTPTVSKKEEFEALPSSFTVSLCEGNKTIATVKVTVVKPQYKLTSENELEGNELSVDVLKDNDKSVIFTLSANYDGKEFEKPVEEVTFKLDSGKLTGRVEEKDDRIIFTPEFDANKNSPADILGADHKISVKALVDGKEVASSTVSFSVIKPKYKLTTKNELEGKTLSLDLLKDNDKSVIFTLSADYDGKGYEKPVEEVTFKLDSGKLTGRVEEKDDRIIFTPEFDANKNSPADILGSDHKVSVKAFVNGAEVASSTVSFSVSSASYKLTVDNPISTAFTLDSIKTNDQSVVFTVLADYTGSGSFGSLADWDSAVYERVTITSGKLPGKYETLYDAGGKAIGKAFTPLYDENNNNGVVFTEVAGRVHTIKAKLDSLSAKTTVEVASPVYDVIVKSEGFEIIETDLKGNAQGVEFIVYRDERALNKEELEGLAPYELSIKNDHKCIALIPKVETEVDGSAYLAVVPSYNGCRFISPSLWDWLLPLRINNGTNTIEYKLGDIITPASFNINADKSAWLIAWIIIVIIAIVIWLIICQVFRVRFVKGSFYLISYVKVGSHWVCSHPSVYKSNKTRGVFPAQIIPFGCVKKNIGGIVLRTVRENFLEKVIPTFTVSDNNTLIGHDTPCTKKIDPTQSMLKVAEAGGYEHTAGGRAAQVRYTEAQLGGTPITKYTALTKNTVIFKKLSEESIIAVVFIPKK